jgi:hypothetical protein
MLQTTLAKPPHKSHSDGHYPYGAVLAVDVHRIVLNVGPTAYIKSRRPRQGLPAFAEVQWA